MSNDMRIIKFKMIIRDIWEDLGKETLADDLDVKGWVYGWLPIIYDYDKLNDYGKVIIKQIYYYDGFGDVFGDKEFSDMLGHVGNHIDIERRMNAAKALVAKLSGEGDVYNIKYHGDPKEKGLLFMFWSLMILAVDDTDKEEHLSLICDFAKMLKISDMEMMDIVQIIQAIYHVERNFNIQTRDVITCFRKVIERYGVKFATDSLVEMT